MKKGAVLVAIGIFLTVLAPGVAGAARLVFGIVLADGTISSGHGFSVLGHSCDGSCVYTLQITKPPKNLGRMTCVATTNFPDMATLMISDWGLTSETDPTHWLEYGIDVWGPGPGRPGFAFELICVQ